MHLDYSTKANLRGDSNGGADILVGGSAVILASRRRTRTRTPTPSGLGFGADGPLQDAFAYVGKYGGAPTEAELHVEHLALRQERADLRARRDVCVPGGATACPTIDTVCASTLANPCRTVRGLHVTSHSESYGAGFYSEGIDDANTEISANNNVYLRSGAR